MVKRERNTLAKNHFFCIVTNKQIIIKTFLFQFPFHLHSTLFESKTFFIKIVCIQIFNEFVKLPLCSQLLWQQRVQKSMCVYLNENSKILK